ncbi:hypothetical protein AYI70_g4181 [Smittium culicis]|uniref:SH3 domain-containing protein n=1 Tax=Smittium culicis TaxID=133412 RepID=A0A1R1Y084_9FUNG|nr:hypothetical protein AYI70_g4181 [Smittium culicis]
MKFKSFAAIVSVTGKFFITAAIVSQNSNIPDISFLLSAFNSDDTSFVSNSESCFPLSGSKVCGQFFGSYYLPKVNTQQLTINNVTDLDTFMIQYFGSRLDNKNLQDTFGCSQMENVGSPKLRTQFVCRGLLSSQASNLCNKDIAQKNISGYGVDGTSKGSQSNNIPSICRSNCLGYLDSWSSMISNDAVCSNVTDLVSRISDLKLICTSDPFNGDGANCLDFRSYINSACRFKSAEEKGACGHCTKNPNDQCCKEYDILNSCLKKSVSRSKVISIVSICVAVVALILLIASVFMLFMRVGIRNLFKRNRSEGFENNNKKEPNDLNQFNSSKIVSSGESDKSGTNSITFDTNNVNRKLGDNNSNKNNKNSKYVLSNEPHRNSYDLSKSLTNDSSNYPSRLKSSNSSNNQKNDISNDTKKFPQLSKSKKASKSNMDTVSNIKQTRLQNLKTLRRKSNLAIRNSVPNLDSGSKPITKANQLFKSPISNPSLVRSTLSDPTALPLGSRVQSAHNSPIFVDLRNKYLQSMSKSEDIKQAIVEEIEKFETASSTDDSGAESLIYCENKELENKTLNVIYPYAPKEYDELELVSGDSVKVIKVFSDGWALVEHLVNGRAGVIPIVCISPSKN